MSTPATENAVSELRAFLTGDMDTFQRLHDAQDADGRRAFAVVLMLAFSEAAKKQFGERPEPEKIIDFVAEARVGSIGPDTIPPENAERMIRGVLGEENLVSDMDARARGAAQTAMLYALTRSHDASEIDGLLAQAAGEAEAYFQRRASR